MSSGGRLDREEGGFSHPEGMSDPGDKEGEGPTEHRDRDRGGVGRGYRGYTEGFRKVFSRAVGIGWLRP